MSRLEVMEVAEGTTVQVLVANELEDALRGGAVEVATGNLEQQLLQALDAVTAFAASAGARLGKLRDAASPDEVTIELGVAVGTSAGIVFTSASLEGQLKVQLKWTLGQS